MPEISRVQWHSIRFVAIQQMAKWFHPSLFAFLQPDVILEEARSRFLPLPDEARCFVSLAGA